MQLTSFDMLDFFSIVKQQVFSEGVMPFIGKIIYAFAHSKPMCAIIL